MKEQDFSEIIRSVSSAREKELYSQIEELRSEVERLREERNHAEQLHWSLYYDISNVIEKFDAP